MKKLIFAGTNTSGIPAKPELDPIYSADDDKEAVLDDSIKELEEDFDFILSSLNQVSLEDAFSQVSKLQETLKNIIQDMASLISE